MTKTQIVALVIFFAVFSLPRLRGEEPPRKESESAIQYRAAAERGNADAQLLVGLSYLQGNGVQKDESEAIKWFRKAATNGPGNSEAQSMLGTCYLLGSCGLEKNLKEGLNWTRKAADQNNAEAQVCMGQLYTKQEPIDWGGPDYKGLTPKQLEEIKTVSYVGIEEVIDQDDSTAVDWFRKAIKNGNVNARTQLAAAYQYGSGVPEDYVEAYKWYILAAAQGDVAGRIYRDGMNGKLTRSQVAEAQKRASKWMKDNPEIWKKGQVDAQSVSRALKGMRQQSAQASQR